MAARMKKSAISNHKSAIYIGEVSPTRLGPVWVGVTDQGLAAVEFEIGKEAFMQRLKRRGFDPVLYDPRRTQQATRQIAEYLEGKRRDFDLPIDWSVLKPFQEQVLRATFAIPYGRVATYQDIARQVGKTGAARAVGRAEATNPMPLVIPCHRVIGTDGALHGYGGPGGIPTKAWLLEMEGSNAHFRM